MAERDDTDELPPVPTPAPVPPPDRTERVPTEDLATTRIPTDEGAATPVEVPTRGRRGRADASEQEERRGRFGPARRRSLMWNAGHGLVSGLLLLVLWAGDRPVDVLPDWASLAAGIAFVLWAGILAAAAAGGVGRTATALVAFLNLLVGGVVLTLGWLTVSIPTLVVVVAAQVVGIGVVQLLATVRR